MKIALYLQLPKMATKPTVGNLHIENGEAYLFVERELKAKLVKPELILFNSDGMKLRGFEPDGFDRSGREKFKYQEWWCQWLQQ